MINAEKWEFKKTDWKIYYKVKSNYFLRAYRENYEAFWI